MSFNFVLFCAKYKLSKSVEPFRQWILLRGYSPDIMELTELEDMYLRLAYEFGQRARAVQES